MLVFRGLARDVVSVLWRKRKFGYPLAAKCWICGGFAQVIGDLQNTARTPVPKSTKNDGKR